MSTFQSELLDKFGWIPLAVVLTNMMATALGVTPVHHLLLAELYPSDIRALSLGITQAISFGTGTIHIKLFPTIIGSLQVIKIVGQSTSSTHL